ncbi:spore gernimation protein, partial [Neobacillus drentensis]
MRNIITFIIIAIQLFLLTGCWGSKKIEGETYITAIGLDYRDGLYKMYIQGLNFGNIAKQEGASTSQPAPPILIGEAKGKSIQSAYSKLQQNAALPLYLGHVHTILLSKNMLKEKMRSVNQFIGQEPLLRYNTLLFGTDNDIK